MRRREVGRAAGTLAVGGSEPYARSLYTPPHQPIRRSVVEAPRPDMACCHAIEMQIWGVRPPPRVRLPISLFGAREQIRRPVRDRPARATAHVRGVRVCVGARCLPPIYVYAHGALVVYGRAMR